MGPRLSAATEHEPTVGLGIDGADRQRTPEPVGGLGFQPEGGAPRRLDRWSEPVVRFLTRFPRWLVLANLSALSVLLWWVVLGFELAGHRVHLGSTLVLVISLASTVITLVLIDALDRLGTMRRSLTERDDGGHLDALTGVLSRHGVTEEIGRRLECLDGGGVAGVLFCDVDRLHVVNDSLGHDAGDQVLQIVAARLAGAVRNGDVVGRFGGDKFVVVSSGLPTARDLEKLADRLIDSLARPVILADGSSQVVSCSIGIAWTANGSGGRGSTVAPRRASIDTATTSELLRDAGNAMNSVKGGGGRGYALFDPEVRARAVARLQLEQDLRRGIGEGEIVVHYQPIIDVATGDADRYEALVRWQHPQRGMIHPADFLSVAAESSLIVDIGDLVLHQACRQAVTWTEEVGHPVTVAVNLAERQLLDLALVGSVSRALAESGLPSGQLELEITEELVADELDRAVLVLRQLNLLGVSLAIDDFGTSQASLARLRQLAMVSTLKIDRVFVEGLADASIDRSIVAAVVHLAEEIGMSVVAEGVEQLDQSRILSELGVRFQQGFLYQRPGPPDVIERHLRRLAQRPRLVSGASHPEPASPSGQPTTAIRPPVASSSSTADRDADAGQDSGDSGGGASDSSGSGPS